MHRDGRMPGAGRPALFVDDGLRGPDAARNARSCTDAPSRRAFPGRRPSPPYTPRSWTAAAASGVS